MNEYKSCTLCARRCGKDRSISVGYCGATDKLRVARAALHFWEEPVISGTRGSGTIFFSGCSLGCIYCQNREISRGLSGIEITEERLSEIMLELEGQGAHNINFVTPTHYAPSVIQATRIAKEKGMRIPTVYNTGGYDSIETVKSLDGTIDIYLPDLKYYKEETAVRYSAAPEYSAFARSAIAEMVKQVGSPRLNSEGVLIRGVIVRILLLPSHLAEAKLNVRYLHDSFGDDIYISLMSQYTPRENLTSPLNRRVTIGEYRELCEYASSIGVRLGFTQEASSASESFIPPFDNTGVLKV